MNIQFVLEYTLNGSDKTLSLKENHVVNSDRFQIYDISYSIVINNQDRKVQIQPVEFCDHQVKKVKCENIMLFKQLNFSQLNPQRLKIVVDSISVISCFKFVYLENYEFPKEAIKYLHENYHWKYIEASYFNKWVDKDTLDDDTAPGEFCILCPQFSLYDPAKLIKKEEIPCSVIAVEINNPSCDYSASEVTQYGVFKMLFEYCSFLTKSNFQELVKPHKFKFGVNNDDDHPIDISVTVYQFPNSRSQNLSLSLANQCLSCQDYDDSKHNTVFVYTAAELYDEFKVLFQQY